MFPIVDLAGGAFERGRSHGTQARARRALGRNVRAGAAAGASRGMIRAAARSRCPRTACGHFLENR